MRKHLSGFKAEMHRLFHNKILLISFIVMFIIPILYGGFFLGSIWDPYGKTNEIPVAVVNNDQPATINGKTLTIGDDVVTNLKQNHDINWQFVSSDEAQKGLDNGTYYMTLTIPKDFSKNATTITDAHPAESHILYTITPSKNYVGSIISTQAANSVIANVKQTVTNQYASTLLANVSTLRAGMHEASDGAGQLATGSEQLQSGIIAYTGGVSQIQNGTGQLATGLSQLNTGAAQLSGGLNQLNNQLPTDTQIAQLTSGVSQIQSGLNQLNAAVSTPNPQISALQSSVSTNAQQVATDALTYKTTAAQANTSLTNVATAVGIAGATAQPTVTVNTSDAAAVLSMLRLAGTLAADSGTLLTNLQSLTGVLSAQQTTLQTSVAQITGGMNTFAPNAISAFNGYNTIRTASSQLGSGAGQLSNGLAQSATGASSLFAGSSRLSANSQALIDGSAQLSTGSTTLANALTSATNKLDMQPTGAATAQQISSPVTGNKTEKGHVPNYGFALSPYVLALGLYVGALVFTVIYPVRDRLGHPHSALEWLLSKLTTASIMSVGQVAVLAGVMCGILGLHPVHIFGFLALLLVTSWTFMSITNFLAIALNNPGRFIAMLLLVLQLGGSEGVFPLQTLPKFFQVINPWLPMTYAIRGLRQAISGDVGGQSILGNTLVVLAFGIVANVLLYTVLSLRHNRGFAHTSPTAA